MELKKAIIADNPNPKFLQLVETAFDLFWRHGVRRVSVEEICRTADVSKMTFYKHFANKTKLALYVFEKVFQVAREKYDRLMAEDLPFIEKSRGILELKLDATKGFSDEIMQEMYVQPIPEVAAFMQEQIQLSFKKVREDFARAQKKGEIRQDIKIDFIIYFMNHMLEMLKDDNFTQLYSTVQELSAELLNFFFYGIMPRNEHCKRLS
jgi:AcrR family transcriptional regulator